MPKINVRRKWNPYQKHLKCGNENHLKSDEKGEKANGKHVVK